MLDIKEYLKQTRTVLVTQDAFDELVRKASAQPEITDEQAIEHLQSTGWMQNHDREMYESGLRKQLADDSGSYDSLIPCEDTISRQAAVDVARNCSVKEVTPAYMLINKAEVMTELMMLPSAQPERKPGQWQEDPSGYGFWICSACGFVSEASGADLLYNFCPHCGADMRQREEEQDG